MLGPMSRSLVSSGARLAFIAGLAACGGSQGDEGPGAPSPTVSCLEDARLDRYTDSAAGELDKVGELGVLSFRFFDLEPSPPAKGSNTFHVQLDSMEGAENASTALLERGLRVDLRMPDHGHGTSVEPVITPDPASSSAGRAFTVAPLYLFMPGIWQLEFEAVEPAAGEGAAPQSMIDRVVLHFCIEG
jgi:hypothetical protein